MAANNSSLIVDESLPVKKGIGSFHFNALHLNNNKSKLFQTSNRSMDSNNDEQQKVFLLKRPHPKPTLIIPNGNIVKLNDDKIPQGDPNVVGLPLPLEDDCDKQQTKKEICDIRSTMMAGSSSIMQQQNFKRISYKNQNSTKSLDEGGSPSLTGAPFSDYSSLSQPYSDAPSIRSLASIGMGSTDGRKMIIRKIPQSPAELFNIINSPTPPEEYLYDVDSYDNNSSTDADSTYRKPRKHHWSNKLQFVLACIGYSVGLGSVWRFPYLCYKSGGGVFLIPYCIIMVICGVPLLYMELAVGQFTGRGPIGALGQLCPLFKGAGLASVVISFLMSTYYSVIIAYTIYYFFTSFKPTQPWEECSNVWNTLDCWVPAKLQQNITRPLNSRTPAEEFYDRKVLQISKGIEYPGMLRWELVACLLCAWFLVYFAIWKSIKSSAKVRYITTTFPFILIVAFLIKSLTLEGANKGMQYFFKPRWELLGEAQVWVSAAAQTFNSMGIAFGSMISFASYNRFNNNILHDTLAVSLVNALTSLIVGIFAFATIGNIASEQNMSVEDVIADGPGLIFYVYPQAMAKMPASRVWAALFFFMLLCLALNSQFAIVEVVVTSIQDGFPTMIKRGLLCHEMLVLIVCVISFLCGLPNVMEGGIYFFQLIDHYAASISIMYLAFFEVIAIAWFYGVQKLSKNIESMTGRAPSLYFKFCWAIAAPLLIFAVWIFCLIDYEPPTYNNGVYHYPLWAVVLGWAISSLSILCIPLYGVYILFVKTSGHTCLERLRSALLPKVYECDKCGEHFCEHIQEPQEQHQPMLSLRTPDIVKNKLNGIHFETPNQSLSRSTPNADGSLTGSPIVIRTTRTDPGSSRYINGQSNTPLIERSVSQTTLTRTERTTQPSVGESGTNEKITSGTGYSDDK